MTEQKQDDKRLILAIGFNETTGRYEINIPSGSNVPECAFGVSALIKCLVREKIMDNQQDFIDLISKYTYDIQYAELEGGEEDVNKGQ